MGSIEFVGILNPKHVREGSAMGVITVRMKILVMGLALVACAPAAAKTCLVLGGGGARGAAHIGVIKVIERERIPIDCVAGTSMGGVVGALYASGYSAADIEAVLDAIDWNRTLRDQPVRALLPMTRKRDELHYLLTTELGLGRDGKLRLPTGAVQGQQLELLLRRLFLPVSDIERFDDLPIPFRTIATDIGTGEGVVFDRGDLALAVRATMSVPGIFAPVDHQQRLLVDGGVVENVPISVARSMGATRVIAVDVGAGLLPKEKLTSSVAITLQTLSALMVRRTQEQLAELGPDDVLITPQLGDIGSAQFDRAMETVPLGQAAADAALGRLRAFSVSEAEYDAWRAQHRRRDFDPPLIAFLEVATQGSRASGRIERRLSDAAGKPLDAASLEQDINEAFAAGDYQRIGYRLVQRDGRTGLQILPEDKAWGPLFWHAGLTLSDDFSGRSNYQLSLEARLTGLNAEGGELRGRLEAGAVGGLRVDFRQPFGSLGQYLVQPYAQYRAYEQPLVLDPGTTLAEFRVRESTTGVELGWMPTPFWQGWLRAETGRDRISVHIGDPAQFEGGRNGWGALSAGLIRDTFDSVQFPRQGSRTQLAYTRITEALGADDDGDAAEATWDKALTRGRHTVLLGLHGKSVFGDPGTIRTASFFGGLTYLSGFGEREVIGNHGVLARAVYYRRFGRLDALFSVPAYVGGSLEYGGAFAERNDINAGNLIIAGSVFMGVESPLGPIFLGYGRNDLDIDSFYLSFGSLLRTIE
ncbi:patatin-like phospholipase family protein [Luteimonas sp. R10]|uniref:patatin-like phospholipase family protein n=1 Tax=Luteimonas sp. R10 TaxID=3108176 RepID=UPI00308FF14A|nr:patatin-like phospholipase family protein [Luteimonas sp. R10]